MDELTGRLAGRYQVQARLGAGGMGEVYRAHDTKLQRTVAIKRLAPDLARQDRHRGRLLREARSAARINHQGVAALYDVIEQGDQILLVMEYVEGQTLRDLLVEPIATDDALEIMHACAEALAAAHAQGIVHHDIKPANIMLTREGQIKVLDFGLAQIAAAADPEYPTLSVLSESQSIAGTPPYMAPEVLLGKKADHRADLFSLGVVFYELLTRTNPFMAATPTAVSDRILHLDPPPLVTMNPALPPQLQAIVSKLLAKDPGLRYATTADLLVDLKSVELQLTQGSLPRLAVSPSPAPVWRQWAGVGIAVVALAFATSYIVDWTTRGRQTPAPPAMSPTAAIDAPVFLAVLPLPLGSGGTPQIQALNDGLAATLTAKLTQLTREHPLQVVSTSTLRARGAESVEQARLEIGINRALTFHLQIENQRARVNVSLVDAGGGLQLDAETVDGRSDDLIGLQEEVADRVLRMLRLQLMPMERGVFATGTDNPRAYSFFVSGEGYLRRRSSEEAESLAIEQFRQALRLDADYALAHAALGEALVRLYARTNEREHLVTAQAECRTAIRLKALEPAGHACLGIVLAETGRYEAAVTAYRDAYELDPTRDEVIRGLADAYGSLNRPERAEATYLEATRLRPHAAEPQSWLGQFYLGQRRMPEAISAYTRAIELAPDSYRSYSNLGVAYYFAEQWGDAKRAFRRSLQIKPDYLFAQSNLGTVMFYEGDYAGAAAAFERALELNATRYVTWGNLGDAYTWAAGLEPKARPAYERAIELALARVAVNPRDARALGALGYYLAMNGDAAAAEDYIARALEQAPESSDILHKAAQAYQSLGDSTRSLEYLRQAIEHGYSRTELRRDPVFAPLRSAEQFTRLLEH